MWCKHCRQDMPAVASEPGGAVRCVRCRRLSDGSDVSAAPHSRRIAELAGHGLDLDDGSTPRIAGQSHSPIEGNASQLVAPSPADELHDDWDDWLVTKELDRIRRRFDLPFSSAPAVDAAIDDERPATDRGSPRRSRAARRSPAPLLAILVFFGLSLGLIAFVCGLVLLGWSLIAGRGDLWGMSLSVTLAGQFGLLFGLLLQIDGLAEGNRRVETKLDELEVQVKRLVQAAKPTSPTSNRRIAGRGRSAARGN